MKKSIYITILSILLYPSAIISQWSVVHQFQGKDFHTIKFLDSDNGFLSGENLFAKTTNGGDTWLTISRIFGFNIFSMECLNQDTIIAVGEQYYGGIGFISYTTDGGFNWDLVYFPNNIGAVNDVKKLDGNQIWAVGDYGAIYKLESGINFWTYSNIAQTDLNAVYFINQNVGWTVGWGELLKTTDGGNSWVELETGSNSRFFDVYFQNENEGWITVYPNQLLHSTDGGESWNVSTLNTNFVNKIFFKNDSLGFITGNGNILKTTNGGISWSLISIQGSSWFDGISCLDENRIYLAGWYSKMYKSTDSGENFTDMHLSEFNNLKSIDMLNTSHGVAVGETGVILNKNGGTWLSGFSDVQTNLNSVSTIDQNTAIAVGDGGIIIKASDQYVNWEEKLSGVNSNLHSVQFIDNSSGWTVGDYGIILKSTNEGDSWNLLNSGISNSLNSIFFLNTVTGWAAGDDGKIIHTTDGGQNWTSQNSGLTDIIYKIEFYNDETGFALAKDSKIIRTDNGGISWNLIYNGSYSYYDLYDLDFYSSTRGWTCGQWGDIYRTTDGGYDWDHQYNSPSLNFYSIDVIDSNIVFIAGTDGTIILTTVGGGDPGQIPVELNSFSAINKNNFVNLSWITSTETNNHGFEIQRKTEMTNWVTIAFKKGKGTTTEPQSYSFSDENLQPGKYSYRLKQVDFDGTYKYSNIVDVEVAPTTYSLSQNYPNPFNPTTTIKYSIGDVGTSSTSLVQLKVYDVLGNEVAILVNKEQPAGNYSVELDGSKLSSGVYFYYLVSGDYIQIRKMLFLK